MPSLQLHDIKVITVDRHIQDNGKVHVINIAITSESMQGRFFISLFSDEEIEIKEGTD